MNSVLNQGYSNYEVILVDDGSTDSSSQLCDIYAKEHKKVKVLHKRNEGVTKARLAGLEIADGEYVAFVDADDWIEKDYIESMTLQMAKADVVACGICREASESREELNCIAEGRYDTPSLKKHLYGHMLYESPPFHFGITPYMCNKLFRRDKILPIFRKMDTRIFCGEDVVINSIYFLSSDEIVLSDDCKYHYCDHPESTIHKMGDNYYLNASYVYQALYHVFLASEYKKILLPQLDQYMRFMIWNKMPEGSSIYGYVYFPFRKIEKGSKVILYGAGKFGHIFYQQVRKTRYCNIVAWVDNNALDIKNEAGIQVKRPEAILEYEYQYIVLAIGDVNVMQEIIKNLADLGVDGSKIVCPDR